jgi:transposase
MARSYQQDLRVRVIDAVINKGMSCRGAAAHFGIGEATAIRWVKHFRLTGLLTPIGTGGHRPSTLRPHRDFIVSEIATQQGDVTLALLCQQLMDALGVRSDLSMMSRFLRREGLTLKKRRSSPANRIARTSAVAARNGRSTRAG